jgi:phytoene dehydrogenase-like protein
VPQSERFDVVVIGAGHNGLAAACVLAKAGRRVVVLERRSVIGGMCAGEEFHRGYQTAGLLHDTGQIRIGLADALHLDEHGLELGPPESVLLAQADGAGIVLSGSQIEGVTERDARRWVEYRAFIDRARRVIEPLLNEIPPDLAAGGLGAMPLAALARSAWAVHRLGRDELSELLRVPPMCVADWLNEWFESDLLKVGLAGAALVGTWAGPWSPGTAANLLLLECATTQSVRGGAAALVSALERASRALGVVVRTGAEVASIRLDSGAATGVVLAGGEEVRAPVVAASCDPRTVFLNLLAPGTLPLVHERRAETIRARGTAAKVHLALSRRLEFTSRPGERVERARVAGRTLDDVERAFDPVKYGRFSESPILDVYVPTVARPDLAPDGGEVVSILAHFAPHALAGGWTDAARERLGDAVVAALARVAPGAAAAVVAREVLTPADIAARFGVAGGHIHHVEHALDQLVMRPTLSTMRYATPVPGLFLCGSGSHPGGGVTGAPGALGAAAILQHR